MDWLTLRNTTPSQARFIDALCARGEFRTLRNPRVLGGGSGYGGKSYGVRTAAVELNGYLARLGFPKARGAIFTKRYTDMADRQVSKFKSEDTLADLGEVKFDRVNLWHFRFHQPWMGIILFRNLEDPNALRGAELDWALVDELTEISKADYAAVLYMIRSSRGLPFKSFGGATNPDGPGHDWVKRYWIERDFSEEAPSVRRTAPDYVFVPFKPQDNPTYSDDVAANLQGHPDPMIRKARWEGSWDLIGGARFSQFRRQLHVVTGDQIRERYAPLLSLGAPSDWRNLFLDRDLFTVWGSLDYGTDIESATSFHLHAADWKGRAITFAELYLRGLFLRQQAAAIKDFMRGWGYEPYATGDQAGLARIYCDPNLITRDSDGITRFDKFRNEGLRLVPGINSRIEGWATLDYLLHYERKVDPETATEEFLSEPQWTIHEGCEQLIRQISSAPRDDVRREDISSKFKNDHALDDTRYGLHSHFRGTAEPKDEPEAFSPEWMRRRAEETQHGPQSLSI